MLFFITHYPFIFRKATLLFVFRLGFENKKATIFVGLCLGF